MTHTKGIIGATALAVVIVAPAVAVGVLPGFVAALICGAAAISSAAFALWEWDFERNNPVD